MPLNKLELLRALSNLAGPPGFEDDVRDHLAKAVKPFADKVRTDRMGNLIASFEGKGPRLMVAAHMDEVGFITTHLHDGGFLNFTMLGGWTRASCPAGRSPSLATRGAPTGTWA